MDRSGKQIDPLKLKVGDLVVVEISCRAMSDNPVHNVAIVDELCGGMEVEHPRLMTSAQVDTTHTGRGAQSGPRPHRIPG